MTNTREQAEMERVRANTAPGINARIDQAIEERVHFYALQERRDISRRIEELDREWSIERALEAESASMGVLGLALGLIVNRRLLVLPAFVAGMMLLHGGQGWYPLLPIFRRLGFRTRQEIDREKYALKALRGDFEEVSSEAGATDARKAWEAVCA